MSSRSWMTRRELADRESVSINTVDNWIRHGVDGVCLGVSYIGGQVRIPLANFEVFNRLIAKRRGVNQAPARSGSGANG